MLTRQQLLAGAVFAAAAVLEPHLAAQEVPHLLARGPAKRVDVDPALSALLETVRAARAGERTIGTMAWTVLALLANGSTLGDGTSRNEVTALAYRLLKHQHANGFVVAHVPCPRNEHLLGVLAITEAGEASQHLQLMNASRVGIPRVAATMRSSAARAPTDEEFVVAMLLARCVTTAKVADETGEADAAREAARSRMVRGKTRRTDAALHLDELLQGKRHPPEYTIAMTWPGNPTTDPLHTLIAALAVSVCPMPEKARVAQFATLAPLDAARETQREHAGTWAPAGGFDRPTTTAMHAITLALANGKTPLSCVK